MAQGKSVPTEVALYLQSRARELIASGELDAGSLAEKSGVTKGQISQLKNHAVGVGWKTLKGMGAVLGLSVDQIEAAAAKWGRENADLVEAASMKVDLPERYPNRLLAAEVGRRTGISEEAVRSVVSWSLKSKEDPNPLEWLEDMRSEDRRLKREADQARADRARHAREKRAQNLAEQAKGHIPAAKESAASAEAAEAKAPRKK